MGIMARPCQKIRHMASHLRCSAQIATVRPFTLSWQPLEFRSVSRHSSFHAIIVAGGQGTRAGLAVPKQYAMLAGKSVLAWSVDAFLAHPACGAIIVVIPDGDEERARAALPHRKVTFAIGGTTRQQSVAAGLAEISKSATGEAIILVHDAARPGVNRADIDRLLDAFDGASDGVIPALAVADTLAKVDASLGDIVPRDGLVRVQTPQAFRLSAIVDAHSRWAGDAASDDAQMVRANGGHIAVVAGDSLLEKITRAEDMLLVERMMTALQNMRTAVGMGYDVHRLVPGDGLWLGGVHIAHDRSLEGHSDADVVLHALTDALLGAIADGDIGTHFPPSAPQWCGASSDQFLFHAAKLVAARGGIINHVDCTIICEVPKVGPHREAMRARIAGCLELPISSVSIKATTTERLGFTGRGEGIAAQAIATITLPEN